MEAVEGGFNINFDVTKNSKTSKDLLHLFRQFNFYHHYKGQKRLPKRLGATNIT